MGSNGFDRMNTVWWKARALNPIRPQRASRRGGWQMGARMDGYSNGQMQVETGAGLRADRRCSAWKGEVWPGDGGRRAVCCMMKYPRSDTGQSPSRSPERSTSSSPVPIPSRSGPEPIQTRLPRPDLTCLLNPRRSFSCNQGSHLCHINSFIYSNSDLTSLDIFCTRKHRPGRLT